MQRAIELSGENSSDGKGGPFGAVVVKNGMIIGEGANSVTKQNDPTAHAEIVAIRAACTFLNSFQLEGCEIYCSCEPCPMCLGAIYWARPDRVYFANSRFDAADAGFDDDFIYKELVVPPVARKIPMIHMPIEDAKNVLNNWQHNPDRIRY